MTGRGGGSALDRADHGALDEVALDEGVDHQHRQRGHRDHGHLHRLGRRHHVHHGGVGVDTARDDHDLTQQHLDRPLRGVVDVKDLVHLCVQVCYIVLEPAGYYTYSI